MKRYLVFLALICTLAAPLKAQEPQEVGQWHLGGLVMRKYATVKVAHDPKVQGVVCHYVYVDKKLSFEDPSDTAIACRRVGPVRFVGPVEMGPEGEVVSQEERDLFFKTFRIRRIVDRNNGVLIYVTYTKKLIEGSNKLSVSSVVLKPGELPAP